MPRRLEHDDFKDVTITPYVHDPEAWDEAARKATAASDVLLDLRGVDLGYGRPRKVSPILEEMLVNHQPLDGFFDEGFKIRGYLYLIEFDSGWIKIGYTESPVERLADHVDRFCRRYAFRITRLWLSVPTLNPRRFEDLLASEAGTQSDCTRLTRDDRSGVGETEMYHGVDLDEIISFAKALPCEPVTPGGVEAIRNSRRQDRHEFEVGQALVQHLRDGGTLEDFQLPTVSRVEKSTVSTASLTDLDLTTVEGLEQLTERRGLWGWDGIDGQRRE